MDDNSPNADEMRKLHNCTLENTPKFSIKGRFKCKVLEIVDGDTFRGGIVFNGNVSIFTFRIYGVNAPEMKPRLIIKDRLNVIRKAKLAKERLSSLIFNKFCVVDVFSFDAFGRALTTVIYDGRSVGDQLLEEGFAENFPFTERHTRVSIVKVSNSTDT